MLNMSSWQELELDVISDIHLDASNVRLETPSNAVEADILGCSPMRTRSA